MAETFCPTIVSTSRISFHTASAYADACEQLGIPYHLVLSRDVIDRSTLGAAVSVTDIDQLASKLKVRLLLHQLIVLLICPLDFSDNYTRWVEQRLSHRSQLMRRLVMGLIRVFPKAKRSRVNHIVRKVMASTGCTNLFPTKDIIVVTIPRHPVLLCSRLQRITTIIESWDHPAKAPIGYVSDRVYVWNDALAEDWLHYQGDKCIGRSYPIKLGYVIEAAEEKVLGKKESYRLMYPMTFASSSDSSMFNEELALVEQICEALERQGHTLVIKPKPNAERGELDRFRLWSHVQISAYQDNDGGANYDLSSTYNERRIKDLQDVDIVVNLGTTFGLDAAAFGVPVLQLVIESTEFPSLSTLVNFPHLKAHMLGDKDALVSITSVEEDLITPDNVMKARMQRSYLLEWLSPVSTPAKTIHEIEER